MARTATQERHVDHDVGFDVLRTMIRHAFIENLTVPNKEDDFRPIFKTDTGNLFDLYLKHLPDSKQRQVHRCDTCSHWFKHFGALATVNRDGTLNPLMWPDADEVPEFYAESVKAVRKAIEQAHIDTVFVSDEYEWGVELTKDEHNNEWTHYSVIPPRSIVHTDRKLTPNQAAAKKLQDVQTVQRALGEFTQAQLETAVTLLQSDALFRSEKVLGAALWLRDLSEVWRNARRSRQVQLNKLWAAVAQAPDGFCHPRSSMIGTLLEDIQAGKPLATIKKAFAEKMAGDQYQRAQTPPKEGNVKAGEKIVEKMGIQESLFRRFARLDELNLRWAASEEDRAARSQAGRTFGHLKTKSKAPYKVQPMRAPGVQRITFAKFLSKIIPSAEKIEAFVPPTVNRFAAYTTAVHESAPPILQWDSAERRNPFSFYMYKDGSEPEQWGLRTSRFIEVTGIALNPAHWYEPAKFTHHAEGALLVLKGARDSNYRECGNALFAETLKGELHEIRATLEAYSQNATLYGYPDASACGLYVSSNNGNSFHLRVTTRTTIQEYLIDQWD